METKLMAHPYSKAAVAQQALVISLNRVINLRQNIALEGRQRNVVCQGIKLRQPILLEKCGVLGDTGLLGRGV